MKIDDLNNYYLGFEHFFPEGAPPSNEPFSKWKDRGEFVNEIKNLTDFDISSGNPKTIKDAQQKLFELTKKGEEISETTPDKFKREQQEAERAAREAAQKEAKEKGIRDTQEFLRQQQERAEKLKEILKNKEIHAKVEAKEPEVKLTPEQTAKLNELKEAAIKSPGPVAEQLAREIKTRIADTTPPEVLDVVANQTAYDAVQTLRGDIESPVIQAAYFQAAVKGPEIPKEVAQMADDLANSKVSQLELSKQVFGSAFGEEVAKAVFAQPGFTQTFSLSQIPEYHSQNLSDQDSLLNDVKNLSIDEAKARIGSHFGGLIEKRIAALPEGHFLRSEFVGNTLGVFGVGPAVNWVAVEGASPIIKFAVSSGYGPLLGAVQSATGLNFGISKAATGAAAKAAAGKVIAGAVVKKGLAGVISKVVMGIGALGSWATFGLSLIGGWILGKIIEKIPWKKVLPFLVGGLLLPFFGPVAAIAGGLGTALIGGATVAGIGAGIGNFFWTLGRATAITIGTPILVTLLVFPVVVALILFIINSGAYVVPPSARSSLLGYDNPYMSVTKVANPDKIGNGAQTVTYTVTVTALKSPLTNIKIASTSCNVIKRNKTKVSCPVENIPDLPSNLSVSPVSPYIFTFTSDFGPNLADSLVSDSVEISADSPEKSGITTSGSETVCVGDCPTSCVKVVDNADPWPGNARSNAEGAALTLAGKYPSLAAKYCSAGEVNLCYRPGVVDLYGWHAHNQFGDNCDIYFKADGLRNETNALFMLGHELTHHIQAISGAESEYRQSGSPRELPLCSYRASTQESEGMAEAVGLYASIPSWGRCVTNYKNQYPRNYTFAKGFME